MVILKYLYRCLPVYVSHSILGFIFTFLNSRAALFQKLFLFPLHFSQFNHILMNTPVFFLQRLRRIPCKFRQGSGSSTKHDVDMEPIHQHANYSCVPLGQHFTHPAGPALLLPLFDQSRPAKLHDRKVCIIVGAQSFSPVWGLRFHCSSQAQKWRSSSTG